MRLLRTALAACACLCAGMLPRIAVAAPLPSTFEVTTLRPVNDLTWAASEWMIDFSAATAGGHVNASLLSADFTRLHTPAPNWLHLRADAAQRDPGLESIFILHHEPVSKSENLMQLVWYSAPTNSTTLLYPAPLMSQDTSCFVFDEVIGQFYAVSASPYRNDPSGEDRWNVTVYVVDGDEFQQYATIWSANFTRGIELHGFEPWVTQCAYNDQLGLLSFHFPQADMAQGSVTTLNISVRLNWNVEADLMSTVSWPPTPSVAAKEDDELADALVDTPMTMAVLGFASERTAEGLLAFAVAHYSATNTSDVSARVGFLDPVTGEETISVAVNSEVAQYAAPHIVWHRASQQLLVLEWSAPYRYTLWSEGYVTYGTIGYGSNGSGLATLGVYPRDS